MSNTFGGHIRDCELLPEHVVSAEHMGHTGNAGCGAYYTCLPESGKSHCSIEKGRLLVWVQSLLRLLVLTLTISDNALLSIK